MELLKYQNEQLSPLFGFLNFKDLTIQSVAFITPNVLLLQTFENDKLYYMELNVYEIGT